ncbi:MAG: hypothetical protein JNJ88_12790 [Planctomycetes bacterium]|nr:hypothetical protein [Planctomycetota bacterium]
MHFTQMLVPNTAAARGRLNALRVQIGRGGLTAEQLDKSADRATLESLRSELYAAGCEASARVLLSDGTRFALRKVQREAYLATLETFVLITRNRGDARPRAVLCEAIL